MNKFEKHYASIHEFKNLELSLKRIDDALKHINFTEADLGKVIHIAGTNGKGSTSFFLNSMLLESGYNTALFTSPHIDKINERIVYNNQEISDYYMDMIFEEYESVIIKHQLSYFEAIFFTALIFFLKQKPDFTILETGLGGKYDATNTSLINKKLCVITSMGYDHASYLGNNIYGIINEKLGILRYNSHLILAYNKPFVQDYIHQKINNTIITISIDNLISDKDYPYPYNENYTTASKIYNYLTGKEYKYNPLLKLPPCRMEKIGNIILDGSHNLQGILKIKKTWKHYNFQAILITVTNDRNINNTVEILKTISHNIIVTTLPDNIRSIDSYKQDNIMFIESPYEAIKYIKENYNGNILVTGSFYLCALIKNIIKENKNA